MSLWQTVQIKIWRREQWHKLSHRGHQSFTSGVRCDWFSGISSCQGNLAPRLLPVLSLHLLSLHLPSFFFRAHLGQAVNDTRHLWWFGGCSEWTVLLRDVGCSAWPMVVKQAQHCSLLAVFSWHIVTCCPSLCLPSIIIRQCSILPLCVVSDIIIFFFELGMPSAIILQMKNSKIQSIRLFVA